MGNSTDSITVAQLQCATEIVLKLIENDATYRISGTVATAFKEVHEAINEAYKTSVTPQS